MTSFVRVIFTVTLGCVRVVMVAMTVVTIGKIKLANSAAASTEWRVVAFP